MLELIKRKNNHGKFYQDGKNLLKQENKDGDPFIDEETGETLYQKIEKKQALARNSYDTSRLDVGYYLVSPTERITLESNT
jgi:predicted patatin/cPLA2 family phospholipase